jgi:hypothetical protein
MGLEFLFKAQLPALEGSLFYFAVICGDFGLQHDSRGVFLHRS